ncbi:MAG: rhomboid family intramembrane serine protease [Desulfobulbaceae bacterium]|nr:rhomboid family intramembrane serine protease [Desulfobulbaceae bacterium]
MADQIMAGDEVVLASVDGEQARLCALVLEAVGIPNRLEHGREGWQCLVPSAEAAEARSQLARYNEENLHWPPPPHSEAARPWAQHQPPTMLAMGALLVFHVVTGSWQEGNLWFASGAVDAFRILRDHQWWRLVTALTLHAGPVHLFSNVFIGGVLIHFLCKTVGGGLGWSMMLLAGSLGNYLNILARSGQHHSVGFSTSVFAAVGILCGLQAQRRNRQGLLLPLGGGASLLALLGAEGEQTDLGAHFWGLAAGFGLGLILAALPAGFRRLIASFPVQAFLFCGCLAMIWGCWRLAL